jgi:hypothetical protein
MSRKIVCSGYLVRCPVGGLSWHHLQYLVGLERLGYEVWYVEEYGWPNSCFDPTIDAMTDDPRYGLAYLEALLKPFGLERSWCYLAEDGSVHGLGREHLAQLCRECDVYLNLSNVNAIPEVEECRYRVLVDTDPVFTQIGAHGLGPPFASYQRRFSFGENVHRPSSDMPTGGVAWLPTRQPIVLDQWPATVGDPVAPFTTVINWSAYGEHTYAGRRYGQKDREFAPFFTLPRDVGEPMEIAMNGPDDVKARLIAGSWVVREPAEVASDPRSYQAYLRASRAEFCVAKHGYVSTHCGWFSDRSAAYLALGRPAIVQDTGFSDFLPSGAGLLPFRTPAEALAQISRLPERYTEHCQAARQIAEEYFDARKVLTALLERCE